MRSKPGPPPTRKNKIGKTAHNRTIDRYSLSHRMFRTYSAVIHPSWLRKKTGSTHILRAVLLCKTFTFFKFTFHIRCVCVRRMWSFLLPIALSINCSAATGPGVRQVCVCAVSLIFFFLNHSFDSVAKPLDEKMRSNVSFFLSCRQNGNIISRHRLPSICIHHFARNV